MNIWMKQFIKIIIFITFFTSSISFARQECGYDIDGEWVCIEVMDNSCSAGRCSDDYFGNEEPGFTLDLKNDGPDWGN